jgi:hypothetical protein
VFRGAAAHPLIIKGELDFSIEFANRRPPALDGGRSAFQYVRASAYLKNTMLKLEFNDRR